ncbi:hypothetical protein [Paracoccus aestuariivivens]|uniref:hypothetical protein n=1 Tax=Paracoccus aestuariivivens TaxID=1820333 RepID=UPI001FE8F8D2|nr:hypothetical protein [Paracoccus aestuariivivens]
MLLPLCDINPLRAMSQAWAAATRASRGSGVKGARSRALRVAFVARTAAAFSAALAAGQDAAPAVLAFTSG